MIATRGLCSRPTGKMEKSVDKKMELNGNSDDTEVQGAEVHIGILRNVRVAYDVSYRGLVDEVTTLVFLLPSMGLREQ